MSRKRKIAVWVIIALIALTVAFIWSNSLKSQERSAESSSEVYNTVKTVLDDVFGEDVVPITHNFIRKTAHFSEFLLLGAEFSLLFIALKKESFKGYLFVLPCGLLVAAVDEGLQTLSDRGAAFADVLIDFSGYLTAVAVFFIIFLIRHRAKTKKLKKSEIDGV
ncbi:MAG: VanZ family protein [Clostridia bacterium]|nr:VanZ family protein [Clostridia bacterium]